MPKPNRFLAGFNVHKNLNIAGYTLTNIEIGHNTISRYHKYEYPMKLYFQSTGNSSSINNLISQFQQYVSGTKIINSEYGNPYSCNFGNIQLMSSDKNNVILQSLGTSVRI